MELEGKTVYLLLGSNLGDRKALLLEAIRRIAHTVGELSASSSFYETAAWGKEDQPSFLNIAVSLQTLMSAHEVLERVLQIEEDLGRTRAERWGARLIDIDIILYSDEVISDGDRLQVPHPRMQERKFVLEPLTEIAGDVIHPLFHQTISTILCLLKDNLEVSKIS